MPGGEGLWLEAGRKKSEAGLVEELRGLRLDTELQRAKRGGRHLDVRRRRRAVQGEAKASRWWLGVGSRWRRNVAERQWRRDVAERRRRGAGRHSVVEAEVEESDAEVQEELRSELRIATPRARLARRAVEVAVRFASGFCPPME